MGKLELELDHLKVKSFQTEEAKDDEDGTIIAQQSSHPYPGCLPTDDHAPTCQDTCGNGCGGGGGGDDPDLIAQG